MNETEVGILALAILCVAGVIVYNKWQEWQQRRKVEEGFSQARQPPAADPLLTGRHEPVMAPPTPVSEEDAVPVPQDGEPDMSVVFAPVVEPSVHPGPVDLPVAQAATGAENRSASALLVLPQTDEMLLSPMMDLIVTLDASAPTDMASFAQTEAASLALFGRRLNYLGFNETENRWEFHPGQQAAGCYQRWQAGLQLVNREGMATRDQIAQFLQAFPRIARQRGMQCHLPEAGVSQWLEQAGELDAFCAGLDIMLSFSFVPDGRKVFTGTKIRGLAEAENMVLVNGAYTLINEEDISLFRFFHVDDSNPFAAGSEYWHGLESLGLTFQFDVPCVPRGAIAYAQMLATIRRFAKALSGMLVDDHGQPLTEEILEQIRQDYVIRPQTHMAEQELPAGSFLARRLFS
jgi:hypothetical protein